MQFKHGDVFIIENEQNDFKNAQIKYLCVCEETNSRKLLDSKLTANNINFIPLEITSKFHFENNLIKNYDKLFKLLKKYKTIYKAIELDAKIHENILKKWTGDRPVHETRQCFYFFVDPDEPENTDIDDNIIFGAFIWHDNPMNLDVGEDKRFIQLSNDLDNLFINQQPLYEHDPEVVEFSVKFKKVYEHLFENYLRNLKPGSATYASLVPKNPKEDDQWNDTNNNNSQTSILFYFDSLQLSEENSKVIDFINVRTFDHSEIYKFHRKICTSHGPYQNALLWCSNYNTGRNTDTGDNEYFLDLPANLYRLLDTD